MSYNIYEDPNLNMNVRYCKGASNDEEDRVERRVEIYESVDADHHVCTRDKGAHTQRHLSAAQRNPLRTVALVVGMLCLLLVAGVIALTKLYISINSERHQLQSRYDDLQSRYNNLSNGLCQIQGTGNQTQGNITEWERFRCSCYYTSTERKTWAESRKDCQARGADLVIINNKEEQEFVSKHGDSWIGLQSVKKNPSWEDEWEWKWVDRSLGQYWVWQDKVNVKREDMDGLTAYIDLDGTWKHTNTGSKQWICERQIY